MTTEISHIRLNLEGRADLIVSCTNTAVRDSIAKLAVSKKSMFSDVPGDIGNNFTAGFERPRIIDNKTLGLTVSEEVLNSIALADGVVRVDENAVFTVPHDPEIGPASNIENDDNWGFDFLSAKSLHQLGCNGSGIRVGVLDTGISAGHKTFENLSIKFQAFDYEGNKLDVAANDSGWHGTHVCGIIAGKNDGHERGIAPSVELIVGQVFQGWDGSVAAIKQGLVWMRDEIRPHLLNLSLGWPGLHDEWAAEIRDLTAAGTLVCCASGNEFHTGNKHRSPGNYGLPGLISVGAINRDTAVWAKSGGGEFSWPADSSLQGMSPKLPMLCGPGVDIISASDDDGYRLSSGTSMASPHVTGLLASLLSHPGFNVEIALEMLSKSLADPEPGFDIRFGNGFISGSKLIENIEALNI